MTFRLFLIIVVLALFSICTLYREAAPKWWTNKLKYQDDCGRQNYLFDPNIVAIFTAAIANGVVILVMDKLYSKVSYK